jgi:hypothetical protein
MLKLTVLVLARCAFGGWLLLVALIAVGSLAGYPSPFVIIGFSIGGIPFWIRVRSLRRLLVVNLGIAIAIAAMPIVLLLSYGAEEGGISEIEPAFRFWLVLVFIAYSLTLLGISIGRVVWLPERQESRPNA